MGSQAGKLQILGCFYGMMLRILGFIVFFLHIFMGFMVVLRDFHVAVLNFTGCPWDFHGFLSAKMVGFKMFQA